MHTWSEIYNQVSIFFRDVDIEVSNNVLIVSFFHQTIDVMRPLGITVISVDNSRIVS